MRLCAAGVRSARPARLYMDMADDRMPEVSRSTMSPSISGPIAPWISLAPDALLCTARSRSSGSSRCTGRCTNMFETWLVAPPSSASFRFPVNRPGTDAISGPRGAVVLGEEPAQSRGAAAAPRRSPLSRARLSSFTRL